MQAEGDAAALSGPCAWHLPDHLPPQRSQLACVLLALILMPRHHCACALPCGMHRCAFRLCAAPTLAGPGVVCRCAARRQLHQLLLLRQVESIDRLCRWRRLVVRVPAVWWTGVALWTCGACVRARARTRTCVAGEARPAKSRRQTGQRKGAGWRAPRSSPCKPAACAVRARACMHVQGYRPLDRQRHGGAKGLVPAVQRPG